MSETACVAASAHAVVGLGLNRPSLRHRKADFTAAGGEALVRSALGRILGTRGASATRAGEIPWRPELWGDDGR